jgi:predicted lipid carrier protein YhbT
MTIERPHSALFRRLPPPPFAPRLLGHALTALLRRIALRKPAILTRLGQYGTARFLIDVRDAPVLMVIAPAAQQIVVSRRSAAPAHDAAIRGDLAAFLSMLHGSEDGDALFFSGTLEVSGDTSAVLALRNALDDAELDLTEELAAITGEPLGRWLRRASDYAARHGGFVLSRQEVTS